MSKINPTISKTFHDLRNTYQALYVYFETRENEEPIFTPERLMEYLKKDLKLMESAIEACKSCGKGA